MTRLLMLGFRMDDALHAACAMHHINAMCMFMLYQLTRKDLLIKNLKRAKRSLDKRGMCRTHAPCMLWGTTGDVLG